MPTVLNYSKLKQLGKSKFSSRRVKFGLKALLKTEQARILCTTSFKSEKDVKTTSAGFCNQICKTPVV